MNRSFLFLLLPVSFLAGCQPKVQVHKFKQNTVTSASNPAVEMIYNQEVKPDNAEKLGEVTIKDNGFSVNCSLTEVLAKAKARAAAMGGDALYVYSIKPPDMWSTCFRIKADILKLQEPYISRRSLAHGGQEHNTLDEGEIVLTEVMPEFPGGEKQFFNHITNNLVYPKSAEQDKVEGLVKLSFVIDRTGKVTDIQVVQGIRDDLDQEAVRLIAMMPEWVPGYQNNKAVPVRYNIPLTFLLNQGVRLFRKKEKTEF